MRRQFRDTLNSLAGDERIVLLLADLSVYLFDSFRQKYPERFYNLGICEGAVVSIAAGVSLQGFIPFVHSIAPFITERCYEQIKLDVCYNQAPINIVSCGATVDYAYDGATHNCYNDMEILRLLPGVEVLQPGSDREVDFLLRHHYDNGRCTYFRLSDYPHQLLLTVEPYKGTVVRDCGSEVTVFTAGPVLQHVVSGLQDLSVNIVYFHTISPLDQTVLHNYSSGRVVVIQDAAGLRQSCIDSGVLPDLTIEPARSFYRGYGRIADAYRALGLDSNGIRQQVITWLDRGGMG